MAAVKTAALKLDENMAIRDFWEWVLGEKKKRPGLSYAKMAKKGGGELDRSAVVKAIKHNSTPSPEMIRLIAAAFDMSPGEVEVQAGLKSAVPRDVVDNRPLILEVIANAQKQSDDELLSIIALQKEMIEQKRRQLRKHNGGKNH